MDQTGDLQRENNEAPGAGSDARAAELARALEQKTALLHEIDHRVKNNLQLIASLLVLQMRRADPPVRSALSAMLKRINAVAIAHRRLFQGENPDRFDVADCLRDLVEDAVAARPQVRTRLELESIEAPAAKAAPLALMVSELLNNSLAHAFPGNRAGEICVSLFRHDDELWIEIADDGVGIAEDAKETLGFGLTIVDLLARQLKGRIEWGPGPGARLWIKAPIGTGAAR